MVGPFEKGLLTCQRFKRRHNFFSSKTHPHVSVTFIRKSLDLLTPRGPPLLPVNRDAAGSGGDPGALSITCLAPGPIFSAPRLVWARRSRRWGRDRRPPLITQSVRTRGPLGERGQETPPATEGQRSGGLSLLPTYCVALDGTIVLFDC